MSHSGLAATFGKLKAAKIDKSVEDLFRLPTTPMGPVATPVFVQQMATAFLDAKTKREDADYNLNEPVSETDARQLRRRVIRAMTAWESATTPADRDAKHTVAILLSTKGKLRDQ